MKVKKILIVEDDPMLSEIYQKKFSMAGYRVDVALSGSEALKKVQSKVFDLILLDLILPEEDGFTILEKIKKDPKIKNNKVIVFSNLSQEEDKKKADHLGAEGFITKSDFTPQEMVIKVGEFLSDSNQSKSNNSNLKKVDVNISGSENSDDKSSIDKLKSDDLNETSTKSGSKNNKKSILLIEDEEVFTEVFGGKLKLEGYEVDVARNGAWGIKNAKEKKYDLIIIDIVMPAMNGIEAIERLKGCENNSQTPIIAFSNSVDEIESEAAVIDAGADLFLVKTRIAPSELVQEVKDMLS